MDEIDAAERRTAHEPVALVADVRRDDERTRGRRYAGHLGDVAAVALLLVDLPADVLRDAHSRPVAEVRVVRRARLPDLRRGGAGGDGHDASRGPREDANKAVRIAHAR